MHHNIRPYCEMTKEFLAGSKTRLFLITASTSTIQRDSAASPEKKTKAISRVLLKARKFEVRAENRNLEFYLPFHFFLHWSEWSKLLIFCLVLFSVYLILGTFPQHITSLQFLASDIKT